MSLADELLNDFEDGEEEELLSNEIHAREEREGERMEEGVIKEEKTWRTWSLRFPSPSWPPRLVIYQVSVYGQVDQEV